MKISFRVQCDDCEAGPNMINCLDCRQLGVDVVKLYRLGEVIADALHRWEKNQQPIEFETGPLPETEEGAK